MHFVADEDAMILQLGAVCTGSVRVKETLQKEGEVEVSGRMHYQFYTILSCKVQVMLQQTTHKKKAKRSIHVDVDKDSEEEDSDAEQVENTNMNNGS